MTLARTWRDRAACRDEEPDLFFPVGESGPYHLQVAEAQAVCRRCSITDWCLQWALETSQEHGIWGATTEADRKSIRRRRQRKNGAAT